MKKIIHQLLSLGLLFLSRNLLVGAQPDAAGLDFFEKKIRPIFVENCYKCHSTQSEKVKGGLLLDTAEGMLKGGDTGPAIVPGKPEQSLFIKALHYTDENLQMPPKGKKLSAEQIADLEMWVKMGAPDPRTGGIKNAKLEVKNSKDHWAFQPVKNPPVPQVKNERWVKTPIDNFILSKLETKGIKPSPPADKRTLIRRATFDLTGLPPTREEVENFDKDKSPKAFEKVVDRLLASPRYGERWGRHWLDIARYADTRGYLAGNEERRFPYSYTYRDYVINALNQDLPYDQFLIQQIAADQLDLGENKRPLAALGFLTLGRQFLGNIHDIIDDRIDVVMRGTQALTVACARCHDHKYDPIPTKDYYSLYGVFANSREPAERPLLGIPPAPTAHAEYLAEKKKREETLQNFIENKETEILTNLRQRSGDYLLASFDVHHLPDKSKTDSLAFDRKLDPAVLQRWIASLETWKKNSNSVFAPWFAFTALSTNEFSIKAKELSATFATNKDSTRVNPIVVQAFVPAPASMKDVAERYGKLLVDVDKRWQEISASNKKLSTEGKTNLPTALPDSSQESIRQILYASDAPPNVSQSEVERLYDVPSIERKRELRRQIAELDAVHPGAPPRAMALEDKNDISNPYVFVRGNPGVAGPQVARQFLEIIGGENRTPFKKGSGRLELAQAIANKENPLTARVFVNHVWLHHFGKGFVITPSDFGVRSDPPTHPELLDYLATRFMEEGWSVKKLHRQIMLSSVYQQSSNDNPRYSQIDPNNSLIWKMNRHRLDFEELRDSILAVSDKLDLTMGGHSVDVIAEPFSSRRTVYGYIDRQNLPGVFRTFDFASPDITSAQRFSTTVPQQALFLLNSRFVVQQARSFLANTNFQKMTEEERVRLLYEKIYQRDPDKEELKLAKHYFKAQLSLPLFSPNKSSWQYGYGEFNPAIQRVKEFHEFPVFFNRHWQKSSAFPDAQLGYAMLDIEGGHPGNRQEHSVIRRWISPIDGTIKIEGTLSHLLKGDGVQGRIISSRAGLLGKWSARNSQAETTIEKCEVKQGDTIDFMTDIKKNSNNDTFKWSPVIKMIKLAYGAPTPSQTEWNSRRDFDGPPADTRPLTAWEKYAQILLLSNEFVFVD